MLSHWGKSKFLDLSAVCARETSKRCVVIGARWASGNVCYHADAPQFLMIVNYRTDSLRPQLLNVR